MNMENSILIRNLTGLQWYWRADFINELNDTAIASHIKFANALPSMQSSMHLYPINGAAARIKKSDTTWNYRDTLFSTDLFKSNYTLFIDRTLNIINNYCLSFNLS